MTPNRHTRGETEHAASLMLGDEIIGWPHAASTVIGLVTGAPWAQSEGTVLIRIDGPQGIEQLTVAADAEVSILRPRHATGRPLHTPALDRLRNGAALLVAHGIDADVIDARPARAETGRTAVEVVYEPTGRPQ